MVEVARGLFNEQLDTSASGANAIMYTNKNVAIVNGTSPRLVKTNIPNLIKLEPMGSYYGRGKVHFAGNKLLCRPINLSS